MVRVGSASSFRWWTRWWGDPAGVVSGGCELCSVAVMSDDRTEMRARAVERR